MAGGDADFAVVERQGHELGRGFQHGGLGADDDALERPAEQTDPRRGCRSCRDREVASTMLI